MTWDSRHAAGRRDFIKAATIMISGLISTAIGLPSLAYLLAPAMRVVAEDDWIDLGRLERYPPGIPTLFEFTRTRVNGWERTGMTYGAFVVREDGNRLRVFSNICTHLGCRVSWHSDMQHFISPCHDGHFDRLGGNVSGPPPRPLDEFVTKLEGENLFIQLPPFKRAS